MHRRFSFPALFLTLILGGYAVMATAQDNPYSASVPVEDQSQKSQDKALRLTLASVLKNASGQSSASYSSILDRANSLVQQYSFVTDPASGALMFRASFDPRGIDNALRAQGLSVFGVQAAAEEEVVTQVSGIRTPRDYSRTLASMQAVPGVKSVRVDELAGDTLRLRLRIEGGESRLSGALASNAALRRSAEGYVLVN